MSAFPSNDLEYRPLVYFWIEEFRDGKALAQFDPETWKENKFVFKNVKKIGWYPFSLFMALNIYEKTGLIVIPSENPIYELELKEDEKPFICRRNIIEFGTVHICNDCGFKWKRKNIKTKKICPKCQSKNIQKIGERKRKTIYILGKNNREIYKINEDGKVI